MTAIDEPAAIHTQNTSLAIRAFRRAIFIYAAPFLADILPGAFGQSGSGLAVGLADLRSFRRVATALAGGATGCVVLAEAQLPIVFPAAGVAWTTGLCHQSPRIANERIVAEALAVVACEAGGACWALKRAAGRNADAVYAAFIAFAGSKLGFRAAALLANRRSALIGAAPLSLLAKRRQWVRIADTARVVGGFDARRSGATDDHQQAAGAGKGIDTLFFLTASIGAGIAIHAGV